MSENCYCDCLDLAENENAEPESKKMINYYRDLDR